MRTSDTALSAQSRSKVLNAITNTIFRVLIIGNDEMVQETIENFREFKSMVANTGCDLSDEFDTTDPKELVKACDEDEKTALLYIEMLEELLIEGKVYASMSLGSIYDRGYGRLLETLKDTGCVFMDGKRPRAVDNDICLSLIDVANKDVVDYPSKTRVINTISNTVARAVLYGGVMEQNKLAQIIEKMLPDFCEKWCSDDDKCQELQFLRALVLFLRKGLRAAEVAITPLSETQNEILDEFKWMAEEAVDNGPELRLFDVYYNAFQRVVSLCLDEIALRGSQAPQNTQVLQDFVAWEASLRTNLTEAVWEQNPTDLAGVWELIDVAGQGSLEPMMKLDSMSTFGMRKGVLVNFQGSGALDLDVDTAEGQRWRVKPGPAHLDTCEFTIVSKSEDLVLTYTGYLDRGQRIESRFSKMPIRMTGRVNSMRLGESSIAAGRFIMVKRGIGTGPLVSTEVTTKVDCGSATRWKLGERRVIDTEEGSVIVYRDSKGSFYGMNAKCPHLGLPMKRGKITENADNGEINIRCNFHNSQFSMKDGSCKVWCEKVLGIPGTQRLAELSGKIGGDRGTSATTYKVEVQEGRVCIWV